MDAQNFRKLVKSVVFPGKLFHKLITRSVKKRVIVTKTSSRTIVVQRPSRPLRFSDRGRCYHAIQNVSVLRID